MEKYYTSQAQQSQSNPSNNIFLHESPTVLTMLITGAIVALFTHFLTKRRDRDKYRKEIMKEFEVRYMTVSLVDTLKDVNEGIRKNGEAIQEIQNTMSTSMVTKEEFQAGITQVKGRIDNLIQGTEDQEKV